MRNPVRAELFVGRGINRRRSPTHPLTCHERSNGGGQTSACRIPQVDLDAPDLQPGRGYFASRSQSPENRCHGIHDIADGQTKEQEEKVFCI
jgi:hypothetical protein